MSLATIIIRRTSNLCWYLTDRTLALYSIIIQVSSNLCWYPTIESQYYIVLFYRYPVISAGILQIEYQYYIVLLYRCLVICAGILQIEPQHYIHSIINHCSHISYRCPVIIACIIYVVLNYYKDIMKKNYQLIISIALTPHIGNVFLPLFLNNVLLSILPTRNPCKHKLKILNNKSQM